ncbi:MAG: RNA-directed DNA polymerase, partial [Pseudoalteromonas sp.]|nr:RNA-directed DNA polymerase [Pseudoalteromonas sp.]
MGQVGRLKPKYLGKLDAKQAFFQLPIRRGDIAKTAFRSHRRHYEYLRLPMGCNVSAQLFQRLMNTVLKGLTDRVFVYLDDILIATDTFEQYLETLETVFQRFQEAGLMLRPEKCEFLKKELLYLGNILNKDGLLPDPDNVKAVREFPEPVNVHQMRRFFGLASYYRKFVPKFAAITRCLTQLLRKDVKYEWTETHQKAFDEIKKRLCSAPVLHHA